MALLTVHDIRSARFHAPSSIAEGYDQDDVDIFLDEIAETIAKLTKNSNSGDAHGVLTERDIIDKSFQEPSSISTGYDQDEVDIFLDEVAETIAKLTKGNGNPANANETMSTANVLNDFKNLSADAARIAEPRSTSTASKSSGTISENAGNAFEETQEAKPKKPIVGVVVAVVGIIVGICMGLAFKAILQ